MISISAFIISLSGIVSLLYFRLWEHRNGVRILGTQRVRLDATVASLYMHLERRVPTLDHTLFFRIYHITVHYFALIVLGIVKIIERKMVTLLEYVRGKREVRRGVTRSEFLKQVAQHKESLEKPAKDA
ncbi:MAG: hypothetical protein WD509_01040 [Candidatus Paceibacterota bacterium]